ncbi:cyclase family protein [Indiicoccus explosivorum]|uniref:cyclase family protein n=1 Tax=Indiicoccus explosivorum TaxID=1917864 RepID=UPI000B44BAE9|nr:cyclase family protein [Indiicoccus explosivorum]
MKIWDISMDLDRSTAEWPGDTPFRYRVAAAIAETGSVNIGEVNMSTHIGTHIDAPFHYDQDGLQVHDLPLDIYMGTATVVDVTGIRTISAEHLEKNVRPDGIQAVFLKTGAWPDRTVFPEDYPLYDVSVAAWMEANQIRLLGVDTPSVDPETSKELPMHMAMNRHNRFILEGLVLDGVPAGVYGYAALPLKIKGSDGSPVRAVLTENKNASG